VHVHGDGRLVIDEHQNRVLDGQFVRVFTHVFVLVSVWSLLKDLGRPFTASDVFRDRDASTASPPLGGH
jgi:hypothetical protein